MRALSEAEVASVVEARRATDPTGISAERFGARGASYVLAYLEPPTDQWADEFQLDRERVPLYWDARLLPQEGADVGEGVVTAELSDLPPGGEPPPVSCTSTPTLNTFCPYDTTTSNTRAAINCTASLVGQVTAAESSFSPPIAGIDYYRTVNLGMTGGPTPRPLWGVRVGREPNDSLPVVRQLVVVAGQHGNEWEPIEMARRLIFYYATMYKLGDATVRSLLEQQSILFIPAMNPDGYQFSHSASRGWRANRNLCQSSPSEWATDLNRNFPFAWGSDNIGSSPNCTSSTFRGSAPASEVETNVLLSALTATGYRTVALLNLHSHAGALYHNAGFSTGTISSPSTAVCLDPSNCINPDLGLGDLLMGTERAPFLRHPALTTLPYATGPGLSLTYSANDVLDQTAQYGTLPNGAPKFQASTIELGAPCYGMDQQSPPGLRDQQEADLRTLINNHLTRLPAVAGATTAAFDLPVVQRRNVAPRAAAEPLTLRVAVRNGVSGVSITNLAPVAGTTSLDDMRPGAFYTE